MIGLKLRTFSSGVKVIQEESLNDDIMCNRLLDLASKNPELGISPSMVSSTFHLSLLVAKEQLQLAEEKEVLCRDETMNGVFFFHNTFSLYK